MADYSSYTREQLVKEVVKKEESRKKYKEKLKNVQESLINTTEVLKRNTSLKKQLADTELQHKQRGEEVETLQGRVKASDKAKQDAHDAMIQKQRHISSLEQQLQKAHKRADQAEQASKQAEVSSAHSAAMQQSLQAELDSFRKQLSGLESALQKLEQRQKDHDQEALSLKARAAQPNQAQPDQAQHADRADSMPSTQACSGDTNDDREQGQLRSDVAQLQQQFDMCQEVQRSMQLEMSNWRMAFSGFTHALNPLAGAVATSQLMQISPVGAEGSNIMPRQGSRPDPLEVRGLQGSSPPAGVSQAVRDGTPHAGSTAGDGHDVGRHDTLGAGSDNLSDAAGTSGSLMQPSMHQPSPGVRLLPSQPQQAPQGGPQPQPQAHQFPRLPVTLPQQRLAEPDSDASPMADSPKRKTIALQPGALVPSNARKRKRQAPKSGLEQQAAEKRTCTAAQQQQQSQRQQEFSHSGSLQAYLAQFGIHESDATAVDFLELQLGRIIHPDDDGTGKQAATLASVARDICSAWQLRQCPLECILAAFVASFLECAAPRAQLQTLHGMHPGQGEGSHPPPGPGADPSGIFRGLEQQPMARSWCCPTAQQHGSFSWLLHCAAQLDALLSSPPTKAPAGNPQGGGQGTPPRPGPPAPNPKRRGRPPGSKNKKTLQRLQEMGVSTAPPAKQSSQQPQQQPGEAVPPGQPHGQGRTVEPLKQGTFLSALHQQVLHYLAQACQVQRPGPFETELCCLSAAAAALARLSGQMQAVRVQVLDVLLRSALPMKNQLQCAAAALEVWPEAMTPDPPAPPPHPDGQAPAPTCNLTMLCAHATLQTMTQQLSPPHSTPVRAQSEACQRTDAPHRHKHALQQWSCDQLTHSAVAQIHALYHRQWQQQQQPPQCTASGVAAAQADTLVTAAADADQAGSVGPGAAGHAQMGQYSGELWRTAAAATLLAELELLSGGDQHRASLRWVQVQQSLQLAVGCLGWQWSFKQVVRDRLAGKLHEVLPQAASGDPMSASLLERLAQCMKRVLPILVRQVPQGSIDLSTELHAVLQDLHSIAGRCHQKSVQELVHNLMSQLQGTAVVNDTSALPPCLPDPQTNPTIQPDAVNGTVNPHPGQLQDVDMPQAADLPVNRVDAFTPNCTVSEPLTEAQACEPSRRHLLDVEVEQI